MKKNKYLIAGVCVLVLLFVFGGYKPEFWKHLMNLVRPINQTGTVYPAVTTPVTPYILWNAEGANATIDAKGHANLQCDGNIQFYTPCTGIAVTGGPVGKYLNFPNTYGAATTNFPTPWTGSFTVEFLMNPSTQFARGLNNIMQEKNGNWNISMSTVPPGDWDTTTGYINFDINGTPFKVMMNGSGPKSWSFLDNNWHHFVFKYDAVAGQQQIWIDGQEPTVANGLAKNISGNVTTGGIYFSSSNVYRRYEGKMDEIAIYNTAIPGNLIAEHYNNFQAGLAYSPTTSILSTTSPSTSLSVLDPLDYPVGASLNETTTYLTPPTSQNPLQQLKSIPTPRLKPSSGIIPSINWLDPLYMGLTNSSSDPNNNFPSLDVQISKGVALELAKNFGTTLAVGWDNGPGASYAPGSLHYELAKNGNDNPNLPTSLVIYRNSVTTAGNQIAHLLRQNLASDHYLQKSNGDHIYYINGCGIVNGVWRPSMSWNEYAVDGDAKKDGLIPLLNQMPARSNPVINYFSENQELVPYYWEKQCLDQDPQVVAGTSAAGMGTDTYKYASSKISENYRLAYRDRIFSEPRLVGSKFDMYQTAAWYNGGGFSWDWSVTKNIITPVNGITLQSMDFYPRRIGGLNMWQNADHGFGTFEQMVRGGALTGDKFMRAFTTGGWERNITQNFPIPMYIGALKSLAVAGVEAFNPAYFNNIVGFITSPTTYVVEGAATQYVQGITSRELSFYHNSTLMSGDMPINPGDSSNPNTNYRISAQNPQNVVRARKADNGTNKYMIGAYLMPLDFHPGNVPDNRNIKIKLDGQEIQFENRVIGSTYMYDNTNPVSPVFYQLDKWHESTHPAYWSSDFKAEAEVMDSGTATIKTEGPGVVLKNFTPNNYDSYVAPGSGTTLSYTFQPRNASGSSSVQRYAYVRARSLTGSPVSAQLQIDNGATKSVSVSSSTFCWLKTDTGSAPLMWSGITENTDHNFKFIGQSTNFAFDQFILSSSASLTPGIFCGGGTGDTTPPTVSITAPLAGATVTGSTVTISANASDTSGIQSVVFKVDGIDVGQDTTSPYSITWNSNTVTNATHSITAVATDASPLNNIGTSSAISITVNNVDTIAPSVPQALNATRSLNNAVLSWGASTDTGGSGLLGYRVYKDGSTTALNGTIITGVTYTDTAPTANTAHTYTVKAFDVAGNSSANSNTATITIDTLGPTTTMTAPTNGATLVGNVTVSANITDPSGVDHVDFYRSGSPATIICSTSTSVGSLYSCSWNTATTADGTYNIYAMAYDDATPTNSTTTSTSAISVTLNNNPVSVDTVAPTTTMVAIAGTQSGTITLGANATDAGTPTSGMQYVKFYVNNVAISGGTDTTGGNPTPPASLYQVIWNTASVSNGTHQIKAEGYDNAGNHAFSNTISVTVNNVAGLPDVIVTDISMTPSFVTPNSPVIFSATITNQGTAPTPAGIITGVAFYVDNPVNPYTWSDTYTQSIPAGGSVVLTANGGTAGVSWQGGLGSHTVHANVDDINRYTESNEANNLFQKSFTVANDTTAPTVTITNPLNNANVVRGTTVTKSVNVTDNVGVTKVEYYRNGQLKCTVTTAPFSCNWSIWLLAAKGNVTIYAKAYDAANNVGISPTITVKRI